MLIDTHAHLTDEVYGGASEIINSMQADGLSAIIAASYDIESAKASMKLSERYENIYFTAGVHPSNTDGVKSDYLDELRKLVQHKKCVAVGEIGLDYHYDDTDKPTQIREFLRQLEVVSESGLPVVIHLRDAYEDMLEIVTANLNKMPQRGVMHCFSGSLETAQKYADMGFYISFSGVVTFKNAKKFPEIIRALPKDIILSETDCPYLAPDPYRGTTNYPRYVRRVVERLAEIWEIPFEEAVKITSNNAKRVFGIK